MQYVKLTIKIEGNNNANQWSLQFTSSSIPYFDDDIIHSQSQRPLIDIKGNVTELTWQLPDPAEKFRILIPKDTRFTVEKLLLAGRLNDGWHVWRQVIVICCFALNLSLFITWLAQHLALLRRLCSQPAFISTLLLGLHGILMIWLLPPFQGADENRHWKQAVKLFRNDGQPGSILFRLPVILDAESPRWRSEVPFHGTNLHAMPEIARELAENAGVGYVKHWGYPIVGLVSLLFPPVHTLNEALIFYYTCRVIALVILLAIVLCLWRWGLGSWTLVAFLSFPLVMQQCTVVSTDTVLNLGTLLAVLLFKRHQLVNTNASWLALFLVCCLVVITKPPIYLPILLLPAWFLPWSKAFRPAVWIPSLLGVIVLGTVGFWYLWRIVDGEGIALGEQARKQLYHVFTGPGFVQFFHASMEYPHRFLNPSYWWGPLGWLDTNLSELHVALLWVSLIIAFSLDVVRWVNWMIVRGFTSLWNLIEPIVVCLLNLLFVWWSLALVMYLTITPYQCDSIVGMQVRGHDSRRPLFFAWPATLLPQSNQTVKPRYLWAVVLLLVLGIARAILLAGDLQHRYWG
ncbi:MAG: DUF2142 domain-containing protein [Gemmatales bacterium]